MSCVFQHQDQEAKYFKADLLVFYRGKDVSFKLKLLNYQI